MQLYLKYQKLEKIGPEDTLSLKEDLRRECDWSNTWGMKLNVSKCKIVQFGKKNPRISYLMEDAAGNRCELEESTHERDSGVIIAEDLRWKGHISKIVSKANRILGMLKRTFVCRDPGLQKDLYCHVRPHLEYAVQAWSPFSEGYIKKIEKIQERAT